LPQPPPLQDVVRLPAALPAPPGDATLGGTLDTTPNPTPVTRPPAAPPHPVPLPPTPPPGGDTVPDTQPMDVAPPAYPYFLRKRTARTFSPSPDGAKRLRIDCLAFTHSWFKPTADSYTTYNAAYDRTHARRVLAAAGSRDHGPTATG
jgi:hypothetical protein